MLFQKSIIIYLARKKVWVKNSVNSKSKLYEIAWDGNNPTKVFASIKKTLKASSAKIILGNNLSYLLILQVPQAKTSREHIFSALPALIPEPITTKSFDWKLIGTNPKKKLNLIQVVAVSQKVLNNISYAAKVNKIKIESIDIVSVLLASQTKSLKSAHIILWEGQEKLAVIAQGGNVYFSEDISSGPGKKVSELVNFVEQKHGLKLTDAISDLRTVDKEIVFPSQWKVKKQTLDPMVAAAAKKSKKGKDEEALELKPVDETSTPVEKTEVESASKEETVEKPSDSDAAVESPASATEPETEEPAEKEVAEPEEKDEADESDSDEEEEEEKKPAVNKKLIIILLVVIVVGGLVVGGTLYFKSRVEKTPGGETSSAAVTTPTPTPEPETVALEDYLVQVQNGSGIAGEAGVVKGLLETQGFEEVDTANAASYDFTDTEVSMKKDVPSGVFDEIEKALKDYTVVKKDDLSDSSEFDIVVTVGSTKAGAEEATATPTSATTSTPTATTTATKTPTPTP